MDAKSTHKPGIKTPHFNEVRYSLKAMLEEVQDERKTSSLGRELVDSNEIEKLFATRKRTKK